MPDSTATPPAPEVPAPATRRPRGVINAKYLDEIELVRELVLQARLPENVAPLTARECLPAEIDQLETTAGLLNQAALKAVGRSAARKMDTEEEQAARTRLLNAISPIRTGAKRKYRGEGNQAGRSAYFVGETTNVSLERLLFIAGSILLKLTPQPDPAGTGTLPPEDTLKGITAADLAELQQAHDAYIDKDAAQTTTGNEAGALRQQVEVLYDQVRIQRIDLQLAADLAWPHTNPANAPIRRAFSIPENRPALE
jgi:hypothetical protein